MPSPVRTRRVVVNVWRPGGWSVEPWIICAAELLTVVCRGRYDCGNSNIKFFYKCSCVLPIQISLAFNCRILYGLYLQQSYLLLFGDHPLTLSLLFRKSFPLQPFISSYIFTTWIPRTVYCYFSAYLFSTFSFSVFTL